MCVSVHAYVLGEGSVSAGITQTRSDFDQNLSFRSSTSVPYGVAPGAVALLPDLQVR